MCPGGTARPSARRGRVPHDGGAPGEAWAGGTDVVPLLQRQAGALGGAGFPRRTSLPLPAGGALLHDCGGGEMSLQPGSSAPSPGYQVSAETYL